MGGRVNRLEAIDATSRYVSKAHKVLVLDGVPLDVLLDAARPDLSLVGLVPALLDWYHFPEERALVWQRIKPCTGSVAVAPVLICPDDCDLMCSVVVAQVFAAASMVWWRRLGLDRTKPKESLKETIDAVGTEVEWFSGIGPYCNSRAEYERCLAAFKQ
jgi:hypothetical protein